MCVRGGVGWGGIVSKYNHVHSYDTTTTWCERGRFDRSIYLRAEYNMSFQKKKIPISCRQQEQQQQQQQQKEKKERKIHITCPCTHVRKR
ncbi:hypothetical protein K504DRAFT_288992 [Pleomassaria siparia CBS 279.74]|uniref:Uncharacterized protein n=1 Tax=Pleomassaria siparia CBS 279.74 TaxID=1314801 RepID=A0A6G1K7J4_9PLEO|nr:hypothetical protein K504DRAFT_288992 [Pleomassaria siparia CBS 279.74]